MKFTLVNEGKINPQIFELPPGLKDITDSDIEVEDFTSSFDNSKSILDEDECMTKPMEIKNVKPYIEKNADQAEERFSFKMDENIDICAGESGSNYFKKKNSDAENSQIQHFNEHTDNIVDFIDSSGGTMDAIDVLENKDQLPVKEIVTTQKLLTKNYSSNKHQLK
jgi:hypothetical protein